MLGQRIAQLRRSRHMSQAALARVLRISPSCVGMYEQGRRDPSKEIIVELAVYFGVTTDFLLTGGILPTDERAIARLLLQSYLESGTEIPDAK